MKYLSRPKIVEAFQWKDQAMIDWPDWLKGPHFTLTERGKMAVFNLLHQTWLDVEFGDYIISGDLPGDIYPCREDVFLCSYDEFQEEAPIEEVAIKEQPDKKKKFWKKEYADY